MVDWETEKKQDGWNISFQLRGGLAREFQARQQIYKSFDKQQYAEPDEQYFTEGKVETIPEAIRSLRKSTSLHHSETARSIQGDAAATELAQLHAAAAAARSKVVTAELAQFFSASPQYSRQKWSCTLTCRSAWIWFASPLASSADGQLWQRI